VRFDWNKTEVHFIPEDPFTSHVINVLSLLLPAGERWFCRIYNQALPLVSDETLARDVRGFIGQEASHARAHADLLDHFRERGLDTRPLTDEIEWLFFGLLGDAPFGIEMARGRTARPWLVFRIGIVAAIEMFTCDLGAWALEARALDEAGADPVMLDLLRWHAAEEVEHRAVAFDLYEHVSGNYPARVAHMSLVLPVFIAVWVRATRFLLTEDPTARPDSRSIVRSLLRFERIAREKKTLPPLSRLFRAAGRYVTRGFHPRHEGNPERAAEYLARSPSVVRGAPFADVN
jgi:predicted metal-dependent hydrolase